MTYYTAMSPSTSCDSTTSISREPCPSSRTTGQCGIAPSTFSAGPSAYPTYGATSRLCRNSSTTSFPASPTPSERGMNQILSKLELGYNVRDDRIGVLFPDHLVDFRLSSD